MSVTVIFENESKSEGTFLTVMKGEGDADGERYLFEAGSATYQNTMVSLPPEEVADLTEALLRSMDTKTRNSVIRAGKGITTWRKVTR